MFLLPYFVFLFFKISNPWSLFHSKIYINLRLLG